MLTCFKLIKQWFSPERMALIAGCVTTYAAIGGLLSQTPLMLAIKKLGWNSGLLLNFWLGVLFLIFALIATQDFPPNTRQQVTNNKLAIWQLIKKTIVNHQNWLIGFCGSLLSLPALFFGASWGIIYLQQHGGLTAIESSYVINANIVGAILGSTLIGWLSDRFNTRKIPYFLLGTATGFIAALSAIGGVGIQFLSKLIEYYNSFLSIIWVLIVAIISSIILTLFINKPRKQKNI